jgi:hypothetical protein
VAGVLLVIGSRVPAEVSSDQPAAIVVFPKLIVDSGNHIDTLIRLTNTSDSPLRLHCFWVDATPRCANGTGNCAARVGQEGRCTGDCVEDHWSETDFEMTITARQPIGWQISQGMRACSEIGVDPGSDPDHQPCFVLDGVRFKGLGGQVNGTSNILPVPHDEFVGYLQCIAVDEHGPVERNDIAGEALIVKSQTKISAEPPTGPDVDGYNAIGLQAIAGRNDHDPTLCLGGCTPGQCRGDHNRSCFLDGDCADGDSCSVQCHPNDNCPNGAEYDGCANILLLDHFFDGVEDPVGRGNIVTDLTLVPCSQDYLRQAPKPVTVQFLVINEFEERFSTSKPVTCFKDIQLSNIDTKFNANSIFSAAVNGTLTGQTRIRGVATDDPNHGDALMGIAREFRCFGLAASDCKTRIISTAAMNLHSQGRRPQADLIFLPPE